MENGFCTLETIDISREKWRRIRVFAENNLNKFLLEKWVFLSEQETQHNPLTTKVPGPGPFFSAFPAATFGTEIKARSRRAGFILQQGITSETSRVPIC